MIGGAEEKRKEKKFLSNSHFVFANDMIENLCENRHLFLLRGFFLNSSD